MIRDYSSTFGEQLPDAMLRLTLMFIIAHNVYVMLCNHTKSHAQVIEEKEGDILKATISPLEK